MSEFLLEIFSEEVPARMQGPAREQLAKALTDGLKTANISFDSLDSFVTPRRLVVHITGLPLQQPDVDVEKKGPKIDAPDKAIQGFLGSIGKTLADCEQRELPKGTFWYYVATEKGRPTRMVLADVVAAALDGFSWPKSMRWGSGALRWVRPLKSIIGLFDGEAIPMTWQGFTAGRQTQGHRILGGGETFEVASFADYKSKLYDRGVVLDQDQRRQIIWDEATKLASEAGLRLVEDRGLLEEVTGLVEWPVSLMGSIDDAFMQVPSEVLTASIRANQKYFTLQDAEGRMAAKFIVVANMEANDGGQSIVAGNERVLRARLSDAKFFWDNDLKKPLESFLPGLETMVFHQKLGTTAQKSVRITHLAAQLSHFIPDCDPELAKRAGYLAKADLTTEMVFEFPEVQGIMGRYYAKKDGEDARVAEAVAEHYSPLGPSDACPTAPVSVAVALADKLDTLVGFWAIDEKPTGSKDPFALRRAALGIIRLITENDLRLPLTEAFTKALDPYGDVLDVDKEAVIKDLLSFFADRLKVYLKEKGVRHDLIAAVFALGDEDDLVRLLDRVSALQSFLTEENGANLLAAYKRAANILRIEEKKDGVSYAGDIVDAALVDEAEKSLATALKTVSNAASAALKEEAFEAAMAEFAKLRVPVDAFFETVTVNADDADVRRNRLTLLATLRGVLHQVADFSLIEG